MYKQITEYGRIWKYDTFTFTVPELAAFEDAKAYLKSAWGGKQWLYMPLEDYTGKMLGTFSIVVKSKMTYMDKLVKAQKRKEAKNADRNVAQP